LQEDTKTKQHKTPWGKVIDIIQTRKDSLKKRPSGKKKEDGKTETMDHFHLPSQDSQYSDDLSSPEELPKDVSSTSSVCKRGRTIILRLTTTGIPFFHMRQIHSFPSGPSPTEFGR